jgi:two-component sensor histidine kinase/DNA-binding response OmpR family regulator
MPPPVLNGLRILVVEDEPIIALHIAQTLAEAGAEVIGPVPTVARALRLMDCSQMDAAVIDFRLEGETASVLAHRLAAMGVPFLFHTSSGNNPALIHPGVPIVSKPSRPQKLLAAVCALTRDRAASACGHEHGIVRYRTLTNPDAAKPDTKHPVVEPSPEGERQVVNQEATDLRIRQQELLAELGVTALQRTGLDELLTRAVQIAADGLKAELCKVLEYIPEENRLLLRAGVGWDPGLIGTTSIGADLASPSGFALRTGKPVISNHLEHEERFRTPSLLKAHGVQRAINVILQGDGAPFGVLEVDSRSEGKFSERDIAFLQGAANILGMAIERQRYERSLRHALEHQKVLLDEISHRVKNSLQLVASMFSLQATATQNAELAQGLQEATSRVTAIARIHERLYRTTDISDVDLVPYLADVCNDLAELAPHCEIRYQADGPMPITTDRAVRLALLVTELVTNAAKHAYPAGKQGRVLVRLTHAHQDTVRLSVGDEGRGLPTSFDIERNSSIGIKIVRALITQTGASLSIHQHDPGTEFVIDFPLRPEAG